MDDLALKTKAQFVQYAKRFPGALTAQFLYDTSHSHATINGPCENYGDLHKVRLTTVLVPLHSSKFSARGKVELTTLCNTIDLLLQGRKCQALDLLTQRLKSVLCCEALDQKRREAGWKALSEIELCYVNSQSSTYLTGGEKTFLKDV